MTGQKQQGFVLAVVLWSIVALTLLTGGLIATINATLDQAYRMQDIARQDRDMFSTEQTLIYLISARPRNPAGIGLDPPEQASADLFTRTEITSPRTTLRLDGTVYPGVGHSRFALRDNGGLFSLLEPPAGSLQSLLHAFEVSESDASRWYDQLMDYQDLDDLTRLNGATLEEYRYAGLAEPPNRFMVSPHELRNLPISIEQPLVAEQLIKVSTSRAGGTVNPNTSPEAILQTRLHMDGGDRQRLLDRRAKMLYSSALDLSQDLGLVVGFDELGTGWSANRSVRIELLSELGRQQRWLAVTFTPSTEGQPWYVDYNHPVDLQPSQQESRASDVFQLDRPTGTAAPATDWAFYSAFFPTELPLAQ